MKWIKPSRIQGRIEAPPSKSMMIRAAAAAFLGKGRTRILNPSTCRDAWAALGIIRSMGARISREDRGFTVSSGGRLASGGVLDCGESGLCMRLFTPIAALSGREFLLTAGGSLRQRPMGMMEAPLRSLGAAFSSRNGFPPLRVRGPMRGAEIEIDASLTSQFVTGLLMALPFGRGRSVIRTVRPASKPYLRMTLGVLRDFGVSVSTADDLSRFEIEGGQSCSVESYTVEGDWSGAASVLCAAAAAGEVTVTGLSSSSSQADRAVLDILREAGADVAVGVGTVTVRTGTLRAFSWDASDSPDLIPAVTALACTCVGQSRIHGADRLVHKESDRAAVLLSEFTRIGARISLEDDMLIVEGKRPQGGIVDAHNDHRIAMAAAAAGLVSRKGVGIRGWKCVEKSYPGFFEDLRKIGGRVE